VWKAQWPVLAQINAVSLIDEGTAQVLDILQDKAAATGVIVAVHGFNPEVIDRGRVWPGHGQQGSHGSLGGYFAKAHDVYYQGLTLGSPQVRDGLFADFDVMAAVKKEADKRGLDLFVYILESAGTGGFQRHITGWPKVLEIDVEGRRAQLPCVNHPAYREWKLALLADLYTSYAFEGLLWGVERWGPLHKAIAGDAAACFCRHCREVAVAAGLDWSRVKRGYTELYRLLSGASSGIDQSTLLKCVLANPEILGWEWTWTQSYLSFHRELYGVVKWLEPSRSFGLGLWHYYFINPLLRAEWDLQDFSRSSDFIRPILYHHVEGPRIKRYLDMLKRILPSARHETVWELITEVQGLKLPPLEEFAKDGLPPDYVRQGVANVRSMVLPGTKILAGIGVDVFEEGLATKMKPEDVEAAVLAAHSSGADGITVSRNYAEMRHANLEAIGRAVRSLQGRRAD
jgi:hypothetical protein